MQNMSGIYIKIGDDSAGDYRTHYLGVIDTNNIRTWVELLGFLANSIEGLTTYHEERQREATNPALQQAMWAEEMAGIEYTSERKKEFSKDIESRIAQGWVFPPEIDQTSAPK